MTYDEAKAELDKYERLLDRHIMHQNPPHLVLCSFVSGQNYPRSFHEAMFEAVHDRHLDNKEHLIDLGIIDSQPMLPMVALQMWGNIVLVVLKDYIAWKAGRDEESGKSS